VTNGIRVREVLEGRQRQSGPIVVGTIGGIEPRKGTDVFVEAAEIVRKARPDVEMRLFGSPSGGAVEGWSKAVLRRAIAAGVRHEEGQNGREAVANWDVFVLSSRADPAPLVVFEAMAAAVPVVATRVDGVPEQVGPDAGILVPPEDPDTMASAILSLVRDEDRRRSMGLAGRRRLEEHFTPEREAAGLGQSLPGRHSHLRPVSRQL
jgi:glycosyltransferase involved in cell wall biosynthesis